MGGTTIHVAVAAAEDGLPRISKLLHLSEDSSRSRYPNDSSKATYGWLISSVNSDSDREEGEVSVAERIQTMRRMGRDLNIENL